MEKIGLILAALIVSSIPAKAITVNPAAAVTGDSSNTPQTVVYRDANGAFSNGAITVIPLNAGTTGQIVNAVASPTVDIEQWQINGASVARINANGAFSPAQYRRAQVDALVPASLGELIQVVDYGNFGSDVSGDYILCSATGTSKASQYATVNSTHGVNMNGCGTGK